MRLTLAAIALPHRCKSVLVKAERDRPRLEALPKGANIPALMRDSSLRFSVFPP